MCALPARSIGPLLLGGIDIEAELVEKGAATGVGLGQQFVTAAEVICGQGPDLVIDPARRKRR